MNLSPLLVQRFVDNNGNSLVGGLLYTYAAGTTTPIATYTDSTGSTPNSNPVVANARGEMNVWLNPGLSYKFRLTDQYGALIWSDDNVTSPFSLPITSDSVTYNEGGSGAVTRTVTSKLQESVSVKDFGAVGDGVTDDTAAIQAAIAAAQVAVNTDGKNREVKVPAGTYNISGQLLLPYGVSLRGEGNRSTRIFVTTTFAALTTTGAIRIGAGTSATFGTNVEDLMVECSSIAGSIGIYSSDIQDGGLRHVTVNNFGDYGVRFNGSGGSFGSVNGFGLEHVECFKRNAGGTGGIGISLENGTFPAALTLCQVYGNPANPLGTGYNVSNFPIIANSCNTDGAGVNSVVIGTGVPNAVISGFTSNGWTTAVNITTVGRVVVQGLYKASGTNSIVDAGNGGSVAKTITDGVVPLYVRAAGTPAYLENCNFYGQQDIAGGVGTSLNIDKAGAIGTKRLQLYVGDGTGGTTADNAYIGGLNTALNISAVGLYPPGLVAAGGPQNNAAFYGGTGAPSNTYGNNGDIYINAAGGALTTIYQKRAGTWLGIV